jgi:hypothetical protein
MLQESQLAVFWSSFFDSVVVVVESPTLNHDQFHPQKIHKFSSILTYDGASCTGLSRMLAFCRHEIWHNPADTVLEAFVLLPALFGWRAGSMIVSEEQRFRCTVYSEPKQEPSQQTACLLFFHSSYESLCALARRI